MNKDFKIDRATNTHKRIFDLTLSLLGLTLFAPHPERPCFYRQLEYEQEVLDPPIR
jgi:lipopolysaccharide/colanic/teichoic acid biosynthesis glycosyltransferase